MSAGHAPWCSSLCPSAVTGDDPVTVYDMADLAAQVWNGSAYTNTSGSPNQDFFPCEPDSRNFSYLYLGWRTDFAGIMDYTGDIDPPDLNGIIASAPRGADAAILFNEIDFNLFDSPGPGVPPPNIDNDLSVDLADGPASIFRLREGIERFLITDINNPAASAKAQSELFFMADWVSTDLGQEFNHAPGGCNVLFMDGHVAFIRYINNEQAATPPVMPSLATMVGVLAAAQ